MNPAALRRHHLHITRRLDGLLPGDHPTLHPGHGTEPAETRPYQPGTDDAATIDWAVTARTGTPHIRTTTADRHLTTWALLDLTPSMNFGTTRHTKAHHATTALTATAHLALRHGDRYGTYLLTRDGLHPGPAHTTVPAVLHHLTRPRTPLTAVPPALGPALHRLAATHHRRGLRIVISDFLDDPSTWQPALRRLTARHHVLAVHITDPREHHIPAIGTALFTDPETGRSREITLNRRTTAAYARAAAERHHAITTALRRTGARHLHLSTAGDPVTDLARQLR